MRKHIAMLTPFVVDHPCDAEESVGGRGGEDRSRDVKCGGRCA